MLEIGNNTELFMGKGNYEKSAEYLEAQGVVVPRKPGRQVHLARQALVESC